MVKTKSLMVALSIVLFSSPLFGEIKNPGCDKLQDWASGYNSGDRWKVAPRVQFPGIARDKVIIPVFRQSIMDWSRDDFSNLNQWLNKCRKQAARQKDRASAQTLSQARRAISRVPGMVNQINSTRERVTPAVNELAAAPPSRDLKTAIILAEKVFQGESVRSDLRGLPQNLQQHLFTIENSMRYLPQKDIEQFAAKISARKDALQKDFAEVEGKAEISLEAAKKELAALPLTNESLKDLDRLEKHPSLKFVDKSEAQRFRMAINVKRKDIYYAEKENKKLSGYKQVSEAVKKLDRFEIKTPRDMGRFRDYGRNLRKQELSMVNMMQRAPFDNALNRKLEEAAKIHLPAFKKMLAAIPSTRAGLSQVESSRRDFTGIDGSFPGDWPYRSASLAKLNEISTNLGSDSAGRSRGRSSSADKPRMKNEKTKVVKSQNEKVEWKKAGTIPPPDLSSSSQVNKTKIEGVFLGMSSNGAVKALEGKGYRLEQRNSSKFKLGVGEYLQEYIRMKKGKVEPFPGGKMTREESKAFQTSVAEDSVKIKTITMDAYKGRVGKIALTASSYDSPDAVKKLIIDKLGKPHRESGYADTSWNLDYFQDPGKRSYSDTQLRISIKKTGYTDEINERDIPYTQIRFNTWFCNILPKCMR